jgi:ABC-type uncharacterized transport system ATPase subunit
MGERSISIKATRNEAGDYTYVSTVPGQNPVTTRNIKEGKIIGIIEDFLSQSHLVKIGIAEDFDSPKLSKKYTIEENNLSVGIKKAKAILDKTKSRNNKSIPDTKIKNENTIKNTIIIDGFEDIPIHLN